LNKKDAESDYTYTHYHTYQKPGEATTFFTIWGRLKDVSTPDITKDNLMPPVIIREVSAGVKST
jgi:hypothetical protein